MKSVRKQLIELAQITRTLFQFRTLFSPVLGSRSVPSLAARIIRRSWPCNRVELHLRQNLSVMSASTIDQEPPTKRLKTESNDQDMQDPKPSSESTSAEPLRRLTEQDCGIEVFVNSGLVRFQCQLKELTSDFQVFEVDNDGKVLKLETIPKQEELLAERQEAKAQRVEKEAIIEAKKFDYDSETALALKSLIGDDVFEKVKELLQYSQDWHGEGANAPLPVITSIIDDKEKRTSIHKGIREVFLGSLDTEAREDKKMRISYKQNRQGGGGRGGSRGGSRGGRGRGRGGKGSGGDRREAWSEPGDYTIFTVYKDGRDTMDVANSLSKVLKVPPKIFGYAGTKDKRGCTVQQFSAYRTTINRLATLNGNGALANITFGDFKYASKALTLGDLKGNKFVLVLRNIQGSTDDQINDSFQLIKEKGFVNYYGMQRFGTSSTGTQQVGIHVLRGEYETACNLILSEHSGAWRETKEAKLHWIKSRDASKTLDMMPNKCVAEVAILKHIVKPEQGKDWTGAFNSIPRNLRLMYMHAYQSLTWNNAVTQRLQRFGLSAIAGDLVLIDSPDAENISEKPVARAKTISAEEVSQYSMYDVVLPLPGCDVLYPENEIEKYYSEFMAKEGLDPFKMVRNTKETSLMGSYRKIMSRPIDLEWQILKYTDEQKAEQLVATNLDEIHGKTVVLPTDGPNTAVRLEFQLESAAYATMLLREALSSVPYSV